MKGTDQLFWVNFNQIWNKIVFFLAIYSQYSESFDNIQQFILDFKNY